MINKKYIFVFSERRGAKASVLYEHNAHSQPARRRGRSRAPRKVLNETLLNYKP